MSKVTRLETNPKGVESSQSLVFETRIDAAHSVQVGSEKSPGICEPEALPPQSGPESLSEAEAEKLHRQAAQLAEYLRERQSELDHREAQLNAQVAQLESDARAARLWLGERDAELLERHHALARSEREVAKRLDRLAAMENALGRQAGESKDGDRPIFPAEKSGPSPNLYELARLRDQLVEEQRRFQEDARREWERIAAAKQQAQTEVEKKQQVIQRRSEHLDRCRAALWQLRGELQQLHRETLEIRLATEELWIQLAGTAPPAALTHSLGRVRARLAEEYNLTRAEIAEQKKELEALREELATQCEAFADRKKRYERWAAMQQQEVEIQAQRLAAREQVLQQQHRDALLQTVDCQLQMAR
jgi:hypothetical protein